MDLLISTKGGKLIQNKKILKNINYFSPERIYHDGDLMTKASLKNIHSICQSIMGIFIKPMGLKLYTSNNSELFEIDIDPKYINGECPPLRKKNNLTRGWSYLVSGVLHRFFHKNFNLYKVQCPLDKNHRDYHWWLESKCRKYVIDLTEEQYLNADIKDIRQYGKQTVSLGHTYGQKTKNMAYIIATYNYPNAINLKNISATSYIK